MPGGGGGGGGGGLSRTRREWVPGASPARVSGDWQLSRMAPSSQHVVLETPEPPSLSNT